MGKGLGWGEVKLKPSPENLTFEKFSQVDFLPSHKERGRRIVGQALPDKIILQRLEKHVGGDLQGILRAKEILPSE